MELAFDSKSIRTICESQSHARRVLGARTADVLKHRLADLRAAKSINDIIVGRPRILDSKDNKQMVIDLANGCQMIFCANHPNNPMVESGKLDWQRVSRIKILRIE